MPYLIDATDRPGAASICPSVRDRHLAYLDEHAGIILAAGAKLAEDGRSRTGTFIILDVETREEAAAFIRNDPLHTAETFGAVELHRWRKSYFDRART